MRSRECRTGSGAAVGVLLVVLALALSFLVGCGSGDNGSPAPLDPSSRLRSADRDRWRAERADRGDPFADGLASGDASAWRAAGAAARSGPGHSAPSGPARSGLAGRVGVHAIRGRVRVRGRRLPGRRAARRDRREYRSRIGVPVLGWVTRETEAQPRAGTASPCWRAGLRSAMRRRTHRDTGTMAPGWSTAVSSSGAAARSTRTTRRPGATALPAAISQARAPSRCRAWQFVWKGVMVGSVGRDPVPLQGDATLTYSAANGTLRAEFSDIYELEEGGPHADSVSAVRWRSGDRGRDVRRRRGQQPDRGRVLRPGPCGERGHIRAAGRVRRVRSEAAGR